MITLSRCLATVWLNLKPPTQLTGARRYACSVTWSTIQSLKLELTILGDWVSPPSSAQKVSHQLKRCQEPFLHFWQDFRTMLVSFWLLSDNIGLPGAEMQGRIGAELRSFAPHLLSDSALGFESSNERRRLDRSAREFRLTES